MSGYGKLVLPLLGAAVAIPLLTQGGSDEPAVSAKAWQTGEENVCDDTSDGSQQQNLCNDDESERCGEGDDEGNGVNGEDEHEHHHHHHHRRCVSFCRDIQPIFDNRCTNCHNPSLLRGGLDLTAGNSYSNLVNQPTSPTCMISVPNSVRVVPCDPMGSMLWFKTKPETPRCGNPMPLGSPGLGVIAPDEFTLIERWIAQGAQNN